jgi:hypothetical protein
MAALPVAGEGLFVEAVVAQLVAMLKEETAKLVAVVNGQQQSQAWSAVKLA